MIKRIIYVPTLRCNCQCKHCGQHQFKEEECSPQLICQRIIESKIMCKILSITGGEPFLKEGMADAIANLINISGITVDFTTNGICLSEIKKLVSAVNNKDKDKLLFSVSIDGLPNIHDQIRKYSNAFSKAIETVSYLKTRGISVKINTVMQDLNYDTLHEFECYVKSVVDENLEISWIPQIADISRNNKFPYSDEQIPEIEKRIVADFDHAYLETKGAIKISHCHAGDSSILIAPSGEVYTCLTAYSYKDTDYRQNYKIGDLRNQTLDEIYAQMQSQTAEYKKYVKCCEGCWNPCEVSNELNFYGLDLAALRQELACGKQEKVLLWKAYKRMEYDLSDMRKSVAQLQDLLLQLPRYANIGDNIPRNQKQNIVLYNLIYVIKKTVRRLSRFLIEDQRRYNLKTAEAFDTLLLTTSKIVHSFDELNRIMVKLQEDKEK